MNFKELNIDKFLGFRKHISFRRAKAPNIKTKLSITNVASSNMDFFLSFSFLINCVPCEKPFQPASFQC